MELNINACESGEGYQDSVSVMFNQALADLMNSFYQASDISQFYHGRNITNIEDLAHVSSLAETARAAKANLEKLADDYSIDYDEKKLRIVPMHEYVCIVEKDLWERSVA